MASLWEAVGATIGDPPLGRPSPGRYSPVWAQFCEACDEFLGVRGLIANRSPGWLYRQFHGQGKPPVTTWQELLGRFVNRDAATVAQALEQRVPRSELDLFCWNPRWLVDMTAENTAEKGRFISDRVTQGYITCVQETHWTPEEAAVWQHGLLLRNCFYSTAVNETRLGRQPEGEQGASDGRCGGGRYFPAGGA